MDQEKNTLIIGFLTLLIIICVTIIWSFATTNTAQNSTYSSINTSNSGNSPNATVKPVKINVTPTATVVKPVKTPIPTPTQKSYIEIINPTPEVTETHVQIQPGINTRSLAGYDTLYSLSNQSVSTKMQHININVVNPPLIVDYTFTPTNSTDIKLHEYKELKTYYQINQSIKRPYENAWFLINITDNDNGEVIDQEGFGNTFGLQYQKQIVVEQSGKIGIDLDGQYGNISLTIKMKKPK